jgi:penicillin-binding protein 1A
VAKTARQMGIRTKLSGYPAESLGGLETGVSPLEVANSFATIASGGWRNRPTAIRKVVFPDGEVQKGKDLPKRLRPKRVKVFSRSATNTATSILKSNITSGTGTRASIGCPAAGKTGTTDRNNDAWFAGYTPRLSTAVWVGFPDAQVQMTGLYHGANVDGGTFPAEIWGNYMRQAKGSFCGDFRGGGGSSGYTQSGGSAQTGTTTGSTQATGAGTGTSSPAPAPAPAAPAPSAPAPSQGQTGGAGFDPTLYESPPQSPPSAGGTDTGDG